MTSECPTITCGPPPPGTAHDPTAFRPPPHERSSSRCSRSSPAPAAEGSSARWPSAPPRSRPEAPSPRNRPRRPPTFEGPFFPNKLPLDTDNDLLIINDAITPAVGEITHLSGRLLDSKGDPLRNAVIEIWQCDRDGTYLKQHQQGREEVRHELPGFGRFLTSSTGEYYFRTIKPVPYRAAPRPTSTCRSGRGTRSCSRPSASSRGTRATSATGSSSRSGPATPRATRPSAWTSPRSRARRSASSPRVGHRPRLYAAGLSRPPGVSFRLPSRPRRDQGHPEAQAGAAGRDVAPGA